MIIFFVYETHAHSKFCGYEEGFSLLKHKSNIIMRNFLCRYKQNIERRSELFRDRLSSPLDTAMYWIDHVIKHKNTDHLKSAASQLTWYELYSLDVLAILIASIFLGIYTIKLIISRLAQTFVDKKNEINAHQKFRAKEKITKIMKQE